MKLRIIVVRLLLANGLPAEVIFPLLSAVVLIPLAVMAVTGILVLILLLIMASRFMPVQQAMYSRQAGMAVMEFMHVSTMIMATRPPTDI